MVAFRQGFVRPDHGGRGATLHKQFNGEGPLGSVDWHHRR